MDFSITSQRAKTYSFFKSFSPRSGACIMLGFDPKYYGDSIFQSYHVDDVDLLTDLLSGLAISGEFKEIEKNYYFSFNEKIECVENISASELKEWALKHGYQWISQEQTGEPITEDTTALKAEIDRLKQELDELKKASQAEAKSPVHRQNRQ